MNLLCVNLKLMIFILVTFTDVIHTLKILKRRSSENFVPILPIPETNLYTGTFYKLGMKRFPLGVVTWTEQKNKENTGNYVQIDAKSENIPKYEKSGVWYNDTQWFFVPSVVDGWYTFRNRQLPDALATWSKTFHSDIGHGRLVILNPYADPSHPDNLWKPVPAEEPHGFFQLRTKSIAEGVFTWTEKEYSGVNSHYIQVDFAHDNEPTLTKYDPNNEWWEDVLLTFEPIENELIGEITQIEMQLFPLLEEIKEFTQTDCDNVHSNIFSNVEGAPLIREIKHDMIDHGQLTLKLLGPLSQEQISTKLKISSSSGVMSPPWYADSVEFYTKDIGYQNQSNVAIQLETLERNSINTKVIIPPWSSTEVRVCRQFIDISQGNVEIDVTVFAEVSEYSYRPSMKSNKRIETVYAKLPAKFAYKSLESALFVESPQLDIDERWGLPSTLLRQSQSSEFDGGLKILGSRETEVVILIPGSVKGQFGYRGVVASN